MTSKQQKAGRISLIRKWIQQGEKYDDIIRKIMVQYNVSEDTAESYLDIAAEPFRKKYKEETMSEKNKWMIRRWIELNMPHDDIIRRIMEGYHISEETAESYLNIAAGQEKSITYPAGRFHITIGKRKKEEDTNSAVSPVG